MVRTNVKTQVLVVGAGPGGMAAACAAAEGGCEVVLLDDNAMAGGQIWRGGVGAAADGGRERAARLQRLERSGARVMTGWRVFAVLAAGTLAAVRETAAGAEVMRVRYDALVLATGARERFLPFAGWTLPGVFGAGGMQALVRGGYPVAGKRIVVAGSGPLLMAVAAHLVRAGAAVPVVCEQAGLGRLAQFGAGLWRQPGKLVQGAAYRASMLRTRYRTGCWVTAAKASAERGGLRSVWITDGRRKWEERCDLLACGFHLVPNTELAALLECGFRDEFVRVDAAQRTNVAGVYCVGEPTGIGGLEAALTQGEIAGRACAGIDATASLLERAAGERRFAEGLARAFALRPELRQMAGPETIVCRCEDVRVGAVSGRAGWTDAKLQTRCGMGPCQARVCGPAVEFLLGWKPVSVRPPLAPVPLQGLCWNEEEVLPKEMR